jgi:homogentisate 1,2-dioxygenase
MSVPPQWVRGDTSRQAHVRLPEDTVEDEHGRGGFFGPASHLYRLHPPTDWAGVDGPAAHRAFDLRLADEGGADGLWPSLVLGNHEVSIGWHRLNVPHRPEFKRDVDGDELFFVHTGEGLLRTEYGPFDYRPGHYLLVPRGTTYRFEPSSTTELLAIEAAGERFSLPDRGPLGRHAVFDPAVVDVPEPEAIEEEGEFVVVVKRGGHDTRVTYRFHPCDVVGWKGDLAPLRLHVDDIRPVMSPRYHLPPSAHTTFLAPGFVVCTFAPRPMESDPEALRLPFFHRNVDYDEVLFYHRGEFFSRAGIDEGMLTFHPSGLHHGPQPAARARDAEAAAKAPDAVRIANEVAVMVDSRRPLEVGEHGHRWEIDGYVDSWSV